MHGAGQARAVSGDAGRACSGLRRPGAFQTSGAGAACSGLALPGLNSAQSFAAVPLALAFLTPLLSSARQLDLQIVLLQDFARRAYKQDSDILPPDPVFTLSQFWMAVSLMEVSSLGAAIWPTTRLFFH